MNLRKKLNKIYYVLFLTLNVLSGFSQQNLKPASESFENDAVLKFYNTSKNSSLSTSKKHQRFGNYSLRWDWDGNSSFNTSNFKLLTHSESPLKYRDFFPSSPIFLLSIYNESPQNEKIKISFLNSNNKNVWFQIPINFTGWRRIWVPFFEMKGDIPKKNEEFKFTNLKISTTSKKGTLFFDDIIFSQYQDDRYPYPDYIVPFIKSDTKLGSDHWMPLIRYYDFIKNIKLDPISNQEKLDLFDIEAFITQELIKSNNKAASLKSLQTKFNELNLKKNKINGPPLTFRIEEEFFNSKKQGREKVNDINDFGKILKRLALNYYNTNNEDTKKLIKNMFISGSKYFLDQGWQAGTSNGTKHHIGYAVRELAEAFFIMRVELKEANILKDIGGSLQWLFNLGLILDNEDNFNVNIDYLNTQAYYHLMLIFLSENQEKQAALLKAYSNYISITLSQTDEEWGFKTDGTSWHHNGHYPAYGMGAFKNVPKIFIVLANSVYRIKQEGHNNFKKALLATRAYSHLYDFGFGNAGRHPLEDNNIKSLKSSFLNMAFSGNPENTSKIDKDFAAAYIRLWGEKDKKSDAIFKQAGIKKEKLDNYFTMPYAATAIHRGKYWAAIIKGYSKYVWASEIYVASNRYGRYPANGTIQILNNKGEKSSGFQQHGWDWNRYPGATIVYLPLKELEAKSPLVMYRSNQSFAGAVKLDKDGVFSMILDESMGSNAEGDSKLTFGFPEKLKAKKSVFSFGDKLICIGTNINSIDTKNPTQTNIFQTALKEKNDIIYTSAKDNDKTFPYYNKIANNNSTHTWLIDPYRNGYVFLSKSKIEYKKENQKSYHNKYSINTGKMNKKGKGVKETEGNFASAWINHGTSPKEASYQYIIYPKISNSEKLVEKINTEQSFKILQADSIAHIVLNKETNTTNFVVFKDSLNIENEILNSVSEPSLIMIRKDKTNQITFSVVVPDLNFPEYKKGKFKNFSRPVKITITINGIWEPVSDSILSIKNSKNKTYITLNCKDGLPTIFSLAQKK